MDIQKLKRVTIISTEPEKYLAFKDVDNSEELIGKPKRIIFGNDGIIPDFEEREVIE